MLSLYNIYIIEPPLKASTYAGWSTHLCVKNRGFGNTFLYGATRSKPAKPNGQFFIFGAYHFKPIKLKVLSTLVKSPFNLS